MTEQTREEQLQSLLFLVFAVRFEWSIISLCNDREGFLSLILDGLFIILFKLFDFSMDIYLIDNNRSECQEKRPVCIEKKWQYDVNHIRQIQNGNHKIETKVKSPQSKLTRTCSIDCVYRFCRQMKSNAIKWSPCVHISFIFYQTIHVISVFDSFGNKYFRFVETKTDRH